MDNLANSHIYDSPYTIKGHIKSFVDKIAIIALETGQLIEWPIAQLPKDCNEGLEITVSLHTPLSITVAKNKLAKQLLNELLK